MRQRTAVAPLDLETVRNLGDHGTLYEIGFSRRELNLSAIRSVLVDARQHMEPVLPAAKDGQIASGVSVGLARSGTATVSPKFGLDVSIG